MSQEIQVYRDLSSQMSAIERAGILFAESGMFGCDKKQQGFVLALECVAQHKTPSEILRRYHIVEGRLSLKAPCALADFRKSGGKHKWKVTGDLPPGADPLKIKPDDHYAEGWFKSPDGEELTYRYSMADAIREGVVRAGSRWVKRPGQMLRARVISNALGMLTPEVYAGDDEGEDSPAPTATLDLGGKAPPVDPVKVTVTAPVPEAKPKATAKPEPKVIDVAATVTPAPEVKPQADPDEAELAKMGLAPERKPAPEAPAETKAPGEDAQGLDDETLGKLQESIAEYAVDALHWMRASKWINPGDGLAKVNPKNARRAIKNAATFKAAVLAWKQANPAPAA